jgi:hypothetical protein
MAILSPMWVWALKRAGVIQFLPDESSSLDQQISCSHDPVTDFIYAD